MTGDRVEIPRLRVTTSPQVAADVDRTVHRLPRDRRWQVLRALELGRRGDVVHVTASTFRDESSARVFTGVLVGVAGTGAGLQSEALIVRELREPMGAATGPLLAIPAPTILRVTDRHGDRLLGGA